MPRVSIRLSLAVLAVLSFAACSPKEPWMMEKSTVEEAPLRLVEGRHMVKKPLESMTQDDITEAARVYRKNGAGPLYLVVAYKDHGKIKESDIAVKRAALEDRLRNAGVAQADIVASAVPLETQTPVALIAFDTLEARGPAECDGVAVPGYDVNAEEGNVYKYKTGCAVKNMFARQIANPTDLEGRAGLGGRNDGEHLANVVATQVRPGAPREYLPSYVLSELASGGQ